MKEVFRKDKKKKKKEIKMYGKFHPKMEEDYMEDFGSE